MQFFMNYFDGTDFNLINWHMISLWDLAPDFDEVACIYITSWTTVVLPLIWQNWTLAIVLGAACAAWVSQISWTQIVLVFPRQTQTIVFTSFLLFLQLLPFLNWTPGGRRSCYVAIAMVSGALPVPPEIRAVLHSWSVSDLWSGIELAWTIWNATFALMWFVWCVRLLIRGLLSWVLRVFVSTSR